jgi:hypothetical protein
VSLQRPLPRRRAPTDRHTAPTEAFRSAGTMGTRRPRRACRAACGRVCGGNREWPRRPSRPPRWGTCTGPTGTSGTKQRLRVRPVHRDQRGHGAGHPHGRPGACTGICEPRVAAHGPNGGRSTRTAPCTRLSPSAACAGVCGGDGGHPQATSGADQHAGGAPVPRCQSRPACRGLSRSWPGLRV